MTTTEIDKTEAITFSLKKSLTKRIDECVGKLRCDLSEIAQSDVGMSKSKVVSMLIDEALTKRGF